LVFHSPGLVLWRENKPFLQEIADSFKEADFFSINVNKSPLAKSLNIKAVPSLAYIVDRELFRIEQVLPPPQKIVSVLEGILKGKAYKELKLIRKIKEGIDSEESLKEFYSYIASTTKNGRVKTLFNKIAQESKGHALLLQEFLEKLSGQIYVPSIEQALTKIGSPESFSLLGAITMALKLERQAIKFYRKLSSYSGERLFRKIAQQEGRHLRVLKKEVDYLKKKKLLEEIDSKFISPHLEEVFR